MFQITKDELEETQRTLRLYGCNGLATAHGENVSSRPAPAPEESAYMKWGERCNEAAEAQYIQEQRAAAAAQARETVLDELCENIKEDFKEDFDGELMINYQDFLWTVQSLRTGGE